MLQPKRRPGAKSFEDLHVPYGGESAQEVGQRMIACLTQVMQEEEGPVLAVSHGGAMYAFLLELGLEVPAGARFGNCAICHYSYDKEKGFSLLEVIDPLSGEIYEGK